MAEHASEFTPGQMDIRQQQAAFHAFTLLTKWGSLAAAVVLVQAVLWFCTSAGFFGALPVSVVLAALGFLVLRERGH